MISKKNKIRNKEDINKTIKKGRAFFGKEMLLKTLRDGVEDKKVLVITGKKNIRKANKRNKFKRRVYYLFRESAKNIKNGYFIFFAKKNADSASFNQLKKTFFVLINKSGNKKNEKSQ